MIKMTLEQIMKKELELHGSDRIYRACTDTWIVGRGKTSTMKRRIKNLYNKNYKWDEIYNMYKQLTGRI